MRELLLAVLLLFLPSLAAAQEPPVLPSHQLVQVRVPQTTSERGVEFLKLLEQFRPTAYKDAVGYSIGYGFQTWKGRRVTPAYPRHVTETQADAELRRQLEKYESIVKAKFMGDIPQHAFDALVSVAYNLGCVNAAIVRKVRAGRPVTIRDFLTTANTRSGFHPLLYVRRVREFTMFLGDYDGAAVLDFDVKVAHRTLVRQSLRLDTE